jgi:hypothetical protein
LQEILWNFCRLKDKEKRLALKENPHFYAHLPTSSQAYGGGFKIDPVKDFRHVDRFYVLTDRPSLVYIKTDQYSRCFGNFWCPNGAIIFKCLQVLFLLSQTPFSDVLSDLSGRLERETIIKTSLESTNWRFCTQPPAYTKPNQGDNLNAEGNPRRYRPILSLSLECPCENWKCHMDDLPGSDVLINLRVCAGRVSPDSLVCCIGYSNRVILVLTSAQLLAPLPPTSGRPQYSVAYRTHIDMLDDNSLLKVFCHYRLEDVDGWYLRLTWWKLAHICRRWRSLIFGSSSFLDTCLLLTNGNTSIDSLAHLPLLPFVIDFSNITTTWVRKDEESILAGLQQRGRVRRAVFRALSPSLRACLGAMSGLFPLLEYLSLLSTTEEEASLVIPDTFRAPILRHLALRGIGLPPGPQFLASTVALMTLTLTRIPASSYFPPGHLVTQLQGLPHLDELSIDFAVPIPRPSAERELLPAPIPPVTLPTLKRFIFRGVSAYLENLVAQIHAPLLKRLSITLHFEFAYTLVNLTKFIHTSAHLYCLSTRVLFNSDGASIVPSIGDSGSRRDGGGLTLNVICEPLDWKIDSAAQVCRALEQVLSAVEELTLDLDKDGIPSDPEHAPDNTLWRELLMPFRGVKKFHIRSALSSELSDVLRTESAGLVPDLLPDLQYLEVQLKTNDAYNALSTFIETRHRAGRRVHVLVLPFGSEAVTFKFSHQRSRFDKLSFANYMKNISRAYRKQAMELISICRLFVRAQKQIPASDATLRR